MTATEIAEPTSKAPAPTACHIFKVGLSVPSREDVSYCVGLGIGPSEDHFREWLHRRVTLSRLPFLWAQVDQVQMDSGSDLERLMHMIAYASGCSPFRQVFWRGEEVSLPDCSERFLHGVAAGEGTVPGGGCALLLAGKAIADLRLAGPAQHSISGSVAQGAPCTDRREIHGTVKEAPLPWMAAVMTMLGAMRKRLACLWMA